MTSQITNPLFFSKFLPEELQKLILPYTNHIKVRSEPDFYGTSTILSDKLNLKYTPRSFSSWSHGAPITRLKFPEQVIWNNNWVKHRLVSNSRIKLFLESKGIDKVRAIGSPIIYVDENQVIRKENSVLIMLAHSLSYATFDRSFQQAIEFSKKLLGEGKYVCFCVHSDCFAQNKITSELDKHNIDWFVGSSVSDVNSLRRMRYIFEYFEVVGSDAFGSHFLYSQLFGSKFFFMKPYFEYKAEFFKNDPNWASKQEAFTHTLMEYSEAVVKARHPKYFEGYENALCNKEMAESECGISEKLEPAEVAELLGWNTKDQIICSVPYYGSKLASKIKAKITRTYL